MSRKILVSIFSFVLAFALLGSQASAAEAQKLVIELSKTTATPFDGVIDTQDYIRGRVVAVDADGKPATTIDGDPIDGYEVIVASVNFPEAVALSRDATSTDKSGVTFSVDEEYSLTFDEKGIAEFILDYSGGDDGPEAFRRAAGGPKLTDQIEFTAGPLSTLSESIAIGAPEANTHVVRTGRLTTPRVNTKIPVQNWNNRGKIGYEVARAGQEIVVNVYAAYFDGTTYWMTDNVPPAGRMAALLINVPGAFQFAPMISPPPLARLTNGVATQTLNIEDLRIIQIQNGLWRFLTNIGAPGFVSKTILDSFVQNGYYDATFAGTHLRVAYTIDALSNVSRLTGSKDVDVTGDGEVKVSAYAKNWGSGFFNPADGMYPKNQDYVPLVPADVSKVRIAGLPINTWNDRIVTYGMPQGMTEPPSLNGVNEIYPHDLLMAQNFKAQASELKTQGNPWASTAIYGAIYGLDQYDNLAPFREEVRLGLNVKDKDGAGTFVRFKSGMGTRVTIPAFETITPMAVTATGDLTIKQLYIEEYAVGDGGWEPTEDEPVFSDINSRTKSISFYDYNFVNFASAIFPSEATQIGRSNAKNRLRIWSNTDKENEFETSFNVKYYTSGFAPVRINTEMENPETFLKVAVDEETGEAREDDVYLFSPASGTVGIKITGEEKFRGYIARHVANTVPIAMSPRDTDGIAARDLTDVNVLLDKYERHDTIYVAQTGDIQGDVALFGISDIWGNPFAAGTEFSQLDIEVTFIDENGDRHPALSGITMKDGDFLVRLFPERITDDNNVGFLKVTTASGKSDQIRFNLYPVQNVAMKTLFNPLMNPVANTVKTYLTGIVDDRMLQPVFGKTHTISFGVEDVTVSPTRVTLDSKEPFKYSRATLAANKEKGVITGSADSFKEGTLIVEAKEFDTKPPELVEFAAINCGFEFVLEDDRSGVSHTKTTVQILDSDYKDVTGKFDDPVFVDLLGDNETRLLTQVTVTGDIDPGIYSIFIDAYDKAGNFAEFDRTRNITECDVPEPTCSVEPAFLIAGESDTIVITVEDFRLDDDSTFEFACADVLTIGASEVDPIAGTITIEVTVDEDATAQICPITVRTGAESIECAFEIFADEPKVTISVTVDPAEGGTVTGAGEYNAGDDVTLTATPNAGFEFVEWLENGESIEDNPYTFTATEDRSLVAVFEGEPPVMYTVTLVAGDGGTVSGGGDFADGTSVTVTATPNAAYRFVNWTKDGVEVSPSASYTFTVTEDVTLTANFELIPVPPTCELTITPRVLNGGWLIPRFAVINMVRDDGKSFGAGDTVVFGTAKINPIFSLPLGDRMLTFAILMPGQAADSGFVSVAIGECQGQIDIQYGWLP